MYKERQARYSRRLVKMECSMSQELSKQVNTHSMDTGYCQDRSRKIKQITVKKITIKHERKFVK